jgi:hypothetical protein
MKKSAFILFLIPIAMACSVSNGNEEKNIALIESYVQAVENMDYDAMETLLDDAYLGVGPSVSDSVNKEIAVANWKYNVENLYQSIDYKKSRNIAVVVTTGDNQGEWVSNWAELDITYQDDKGSVTIFANTLYEISNNKVVKSYTIYNEADALRQMGYVFINPNDI